MLVATGLGWAAEQPWVMVVAADVGSASAAPTVQMESWQP
jgi:hypothetical protein